MKSTLYAHIMLIVAGCHSAHGADGFAMIDGTTTGGGNGSTTTVSSAAAFSNAVVSGGGVVQVQGTINLNLAGIGYMPIAGNQTIIGLSTNATVIGNLQVESGNVILRNLFISNPNSNGEGDGLSVSRLNAKHIWIDHCTFSNCLDGEVDITKGADYVTVSWCKFLYTTNFGHNFPNLIGDANSGTPDTNRLHVTFHHNWWSELCIERMPRVRFGRIHSYNNYFNTAVNGNAFTNSHCVTAALYSEMRLENNHFENVRNPWELNITDGATTGKIYAAGNAFVNVTNIPSPPTVVIPPGTDTVFAVPYCYTLDSTNSLAAIVTNSAGAGQPAYDLATNSWSTGSGKWENPGSWSLDAVPSLNDYANLITIGNSNTVTIDAATTNSPATMTISNLTLSGCANSTNTLFLNDAGTNTPLRILNSFAINNGGALLVTNAALRVEGVSGGDFLIDGGGTLLNGASVTATNAGVLTSIGDTASGSLTTFGGSLSAGLFTIGNFAGSQGTLTVAGGTNTLSILYAGLNAGAMGAVWVTGGRLAFSSGTLGFSGVGQMTVSNGTSQANSLEVATGAGSQGTLTVAGGTNSVLNSLLVGNFACSATGTVDVVDGSLFVTNSANNAVLNVRGGTLRLNSGTLVIDSLVITNSCGRFLKTGGSLSITSTNLTPSFDADGDGFTNQEEANAGSSPFDASSIPLNSWINVSSGKWETGANWLATIPPASNQTVFVTNATSKTVTIDATTTNAASTMTVSNLTVSGPVGTTNTLLLSNAGTNTPLRILSSFTNGVGGVVSITNSVLRVDRLGGNGFVNDGEVLLNDGTIVATNASTIVGNTGSSSLTVFGGSMLAGNLTVGFNSFSVGTITFDGGTNTLSGFLDVGRNSNATGTVWMTGGQLAVTNASTIVGVAGIGQMTVSNGTWLADWVRVGDSAGSRGTLTIAGGTNTFSSFFDIGFNNATGAIWMTGGRLAVMNNNTVVGFAGSGQMTVSNGTWLARDTIVGKYAGAQGTLTIAGGTNTLSRFLSIGNDLDATGAVLVTGGQLAVTNYPTDVGVAGIGQMTVSNGTWLADWVRVGVSAGSRGTLTIAGGTNTFSSFFDIGSNLDATGVVWITGGRLMVTNDETDVGSSGIGEMSVSNGAWLAANVVVGASGGSRGTLTVAGGTNTLSGYLHAEAGIVWMTGGQLTVTNQETDVGYYSGISQMSVSNGTWLARDVIVGFNPGSCGTLTIAGGTNTLSSLAIANYQATGTVWLVGGRMTVTNGPAYVGSLGRGRMTVSNGIWSARDVVVAAGFDKGTLTIAGGTSTVSSNLTIGNLSCSAQGVVNIVGGELDVTNALANATLEVRSGTLTLSGGTLQMDRIVMTNSCGFFTRTGGTLVYGTAVLDPNRDDDADGISNGYEESHGLDPLNAADAGTDNDGDGQTNLAEFQSGTDATNNASAFRITAIVKTNIDIRVTWMTGPGKTNALERSAGTANGSYSNNFAGIFTVTNTVGATTNYLDVGAATNFPALYYRVRLVP